MVYLNSLTTVGGCVEVTTGVNDFMKAALHSLSAELDDLCRIFRSVLNCAPKKEVSSFLCSFGSKRFIMYTQLFCTIPMSLLLQQIMFGENLSKLKTSGIVYKQKKTAVLHITTEKRLQDVFFCSWHLSSCFKGTRSDILNEPEGIFSK